MVRGYSNINWWNFGIVKKKLGNLIYLVQLDDSRIWKRHVDQISSIDPVTPLAISHTPSYYFHDPSRIVP